jgi:hypothetical protein
MLGCEKARVVKCPENVPPEKCVPGSGGVDFAVLAIIKSLTLVIANCL